MKIIDLISNSNLIFILLTLLVTITASMVIISKNPVHSVLFLVLVFLLTTVVFLTLNIDFIAMLFLVLYVGAIVVLFLFVVMMLNIRVLELNERVISYVPIAIIIIFIFFILILSLITTDFISASSKFFFKDSFTKELLDSYLRKGKELNYETEISFSNSVMNFNNLNSLGSLLYLNYFFVFILAAIVLLIAMLGSIVLTLNVNKKTKRQDYYTQTNMNIIKSIRHLY